MKQICLYCRTHVDPLLDNCENCGAPVPKFQPEYNTYGSPHFVWDAEALVAIKRPSDLWVYKR